MTTRRTVLASVGALTFAGCLAGGNSADGSQSPIGGDAPESPDSIDTEWPMPGYGAGRSNYTPEAAGPTAPIEPLWSASLDTPLSGPALADETLYVGGDDGVVRALDARTGEEHWRQSVGAAVDAPWAIGDQLFVPTAEAIVALDAGDGTEAWRAETPGRADVLIASHGVYWLSKRGTPTVVCLVRNNGSERWRTDISDPWDTHLFASEAAAFVSTGTNGQRPWTLAPETGEVVGDEPEPGHDFPAERFYIDDTVYAVDPFFGTVVARSDGERGHRWSRGVDAVGDYALSSGARRVYYVANGGDAPGLYALSRTDGTIEWQASTVTEVVGRPVVAREGVFVQGDDSLRCFDPATGTERWSRPSDDIGDQVIAADDLLYTTHDGTVRALRPPSSDGVPDSKDETTTTSAYATCDPASLTEPASAHGIPGDLTQERVARYVERVERDLISPPEEQRTDGHVIIGSITVEVVAQGYLARLPVKGGYYNQARDGNTTETAHYDLGAHAAHYFVNERVVRRVTATDGSVDPRKHGDVIACQPR